MRKLFDKSVTFQRKTVEVDSYGQPIETWKDYIICDAFISQVSGDKRFQSDKDGHFSTHKIKCSFFDITVLDRAVIGGEEHVIMNVNQPNGSDYIEIDISRNV